MIRLTSIRHRFRQGVAALLPRTGSLDSSLAVEWLTSDQIPLFDRMSAHDRAHSLRVAGRLLADGHADRDLIAAALLHDVAKAGTPQIPGQVRLPDRVLRVLLGQFTPAALRWLASDHDRPGCRGLYLATHHARLGSINASEAGSSARTVWLIAHHEDTASSDPELRALVATDDASH